MQRVKIADAFPGKDCGLDRANELRSAQVRARRVELVAPAPQIGDGLGVELAGEVASTCIVKLRCGKERLDECLDVETSSPDDDRLFVDFARTLDPFVGLGSPPSRGKTLLRLRDVDAIMGGTRAFITRRLRRPDRKAAVDLAGVRAYDRGAVQLSELESHRRFTSGGRPADDPHPIASQTAALLRPR